jgi:hypothetical protein
MRRTGARPAPRDGGRGTAAGRHPRADAIPGSGAAPSGRPQEPELRLLRACGSSTCTTTASTVEVRDIATWVRSRSASACPAGMGSCHTRKWAGYFVEGHVPAADVQRLLAENPKRAWPDRSRACRWAPRHGSPRRPVQPYEVVLVGKDGTTVDLVTPRRLNAFVRCAGSHPANGRSHSMSHHLTQAVRDCIAACNDCAIECGNCFSHMVGKESPTTARPAASSAPRCAACAPTPWPATARSPRRSARCAP